MKTVLLKPQRSVPNSILAYHDEDPDHYYEYECEYSDDYFCSNLACEYKIGAGDCTEVYLEWWEGDNLVEVAEGCV